MNTYAIPALKEKRAAIDGRIISLKKQIARHQKELASLDATIALLEPEYRVGSIASKGLQKPSSLTNKEIKTLAASALTQRPDHKGGKK